MSNECRMTPEQFEALEQMIAAAVAYGHVPPGLAHEARRLLVEPEQAEIHDGPCRGGPQAGSSMAMGSEIVKRPGGEYRWSGFLHAWTWDTADPDLTTFGDLKARGWFELTHEGWPKDDRIRLLTQDRVVYDEEGLKRMVENDEPVRRLPKPEWSK